ncbi:Protein of unknown function [Paracidovorax cattleyae]|uniref:SPOR domain-containing protein n=2 Tax=Paracidovorax cattleyae TaxID=80868 RepID=A0A1H0LFV0_9BURK|nr:Protein of unknown function [Paracidovorax cattleyae]
MAALYRAALGPIGVARYLPAFERFDEAGRTLPGWNWAAALCTLNWMVFRQLWSAALVYVAALEGLALLAVAVGRYTGTWPLPVLAGLGLAVLLAATVIPGLYGNAIVHGEIRKRITRALAASATLTQAQERLQEHAPTQRRLVWIGAANAVLALLLAALLLLQPGWSAMDPSAAFHPPATAAEAPRTAASTAQAPASETASEMPSGPPEAASASASAAPAPDATSPAAPASVPAPVETAGVAGASLAASAASPALPPAPTASSTAPAAAPARALPASAAASASTRPAQIQPQAPASAASRRTAPSAPSPASRPAASAAADRTDTIASPARRLYINVGLFAEPANAQRAHGMLRGAGIPAATQPVTAADGRELLRVRAGPFTSTSQANAAAARIRALGLETSAAAAQRP